MKKAIIIFVILLTGCTSLAPSDTQFTPPTIETSENTVTLTPSVTVRSVPPECKNLGQRWVSPVDGMTMICVPEGNFLMGSNPLLDPSSTPEEQPEIMVEMSSYWIDQTEISNAQFAEFIAETEYKTSSDKLNMGYIENKYIMGEINWQHPYGEISSIIGLESHPVIQISWADARAYCEWAGRALPTEAQWEKAAGWDPINKQKLIFPWGNMEGDQKRANYASELTIPPYTMPVNSYPEGASPYGVLNMAGNIAEWTQDNYSRDFYLSVIPGAVNPVNNSSGDLSAELGHVIRGGGWKSGVMEIRTAARRGFGGLSDGGEIIGFRCAYTP